VESIDEEKSKIKANRNKVSKTIKSVPVDTDLNRGRVKVKRLAILPVKPRRNITK
jgi:hypothetical protein